MNHILVIKTNNLNFDFSFTGSDYGDDTYLKDLEIADFNYDNEEF